MRDELGEKHFHYKDVCSSFQNDASRWLRAGHVIIIICHHRFSCRKKQVYEREASSSTLSVLLTRSFPAVFHFHLVCSILKGLRRIDCEHGINLCCGTHFSLSQRRQSLRVRAERRYSCNRTVTPQSSSRHDDCSYVQSL